MIPPEVLAAVADVVEDEFDGTLSPRDRRVIEVAVAAERERIRQLEALAVEMLGAFAFYKHPGRPAVQSGMIDVATVDRWRATLAGGQ